jgi:hypothetical protein
VAPAERIDRKVKTMETIERKAADDMRTEHREKSTRWLATAVAVLVVAVLAISAWLILGDPSENPDVALEQQLTEVTAERDALQAQIDQRSERHDKTVAVKAAVRDILDNPTAYGTEEEVADLLATYATSAAVMEDDVFGSVNMRDAWYRTLYSGAIDAEIEVSHQWISEDGSQSGSLWVWKGTNQAGNPFELIGVAVDTHDEEGLVSHELVVYPYSDTYVIEAVTGAGTEGG